MLVKAVRKFVCSCQFSYRLSLEEEGFKMDQYKIYVQLYQEYYMLQRDLRCLVTALPVP